MTDRDFNYLITISSSIFRLTFQSKNTAKTLNISIIITVSIYNFRTKKRSLFLKNQSLNIEQGIISYWTIYKCTQLRNKRKSERERERNSEREK
jgi:hypothetical protein